MGKPMVGVPMFSDTSVLFLVTDMVVTCSYGSTLRKHTYQTAPNAVDLGAINPLDSQKNCLVQKGIPPFLDYELIPRYEG